MSEAGRTIKPVKPAGRVELRFSDGPFDAEHPVHDLSTLVVDGDLLWSAADEEASIERFQRVGRDAYAHHVRFPLGQILDLPAGPEAEMDIEGLAIDDGWLWVAGSHSLRRKRPDPDKEGTAEALLERLGVVDRQPNRYTLAALPLAPDANGVLAPMAAARDNGVTREAAMLAMTKRGNRLTRELAKDPHLGPFLAVPAKENGFDIEGLAVRGQHVLLGLRGPVLRGYAVILDLAVRPKGRKLKLERLTDEGTRYRKHLVDLRGLGIRDLAFAGDDLLILAGPTMDLDGRQVVFRWRKALDHLDVPLLQESDLEHVAELPVLLDRDRAEGLAIRRGVRGGSELLIAYDSPASDRLDGERSLVLADRLTL